LKRRWEKENFRNVEDLSPEDLRYEANQEERLIDEDARKTLYAIIGRLPERKRRLLDLEFQELISREIANQMRIKIESVYAAKSALLKEIRESLERR